MTFFRMCALVLCVGLLCSCERSHRTLIKLSGNNQTAPQGSYLSNPLKVKLRDGWGFPVANAAVTFIPGGQNSFGRDGLVSRGKNGDGGPWAVLTVNTDAGGCAQVYYACPDRPNALMRVVARAAGADTVFWTATDPNTGTIASPAGIEVRPGAMNTQYILHWINHATNANAILLQHSSDGQTWTTIAVLTPDTTSCLVTERDISKRYFFGVDAAQLDPDERAQAQTDAKGIAIIASIPTPAGATEGK